MHETGPSTGDNHATFEPGMKIKHFQPWLPCIVLYNHKNHRLMRGSDGPGLTVGMHKTSDNIAGPMPGTFGER